MAMIIHPPVLKVADSRCILTTTFEVDGVPQDLWYSFPLEYKDVLVTESCDATVVGLLPLAFQKGVNVLIKGTLSYKLWYSLNNFILPAMSFAHDVKKKIRVDAKDKTLTAYNNYAKGTGLSCGVDALATVSSHKDLTHFVFLNAGSHGDYGGESSNTIFKKRFSNAKSFSETYKLPLIEIDSNISELLNERFQTHHSFRNLSCVLNLQKLFSSYFYSSAYRLDYFKINKNDTSDWDLILVKHLETESLSFFSSGSQFTRLEKTKVVSNFPISYNHLDVCTNPIIAKRTLNCSECEKCLRTQLSLEVLGVLENYRKVFDLVSYYKLRERYLCSLYHKQHKDPIYHDLFVKSKELRKSVSFEKKIKHFVLQSITELKIKLKKRLKS